MRLVMTGKLRERARDVRPFGKAAAPRLLVLGNDVKLRKIIGYELDARTSRGEVEQNPFRFVFRTPVAALAPLQQPAILLRDQAVRFRGRVTHREKSPRPLPWRLQSRGRARNRRHKSAQSRMAGKELSEL